MSLQKKIGLYVTLDDSFTRRIVQGVIQYFRYKDDWNLIGNDWMFSSKLESEYNLDGIISRIKNRDDQLKIARFGVPVVDVAGTYVGHGYYAVHNDDYATGIKAAAYLSRLGHHYFAWAGAKNAQWSKKRFEGYSNNLKHIYKFEKSIHWWEQLKLDVEELQRWLALLPKPVALFAANDAIGLKIIKTCSKSQYAMNISVPENIAVLGVDNEDILCELAVPPLSSIAVDCEQLGYKAAELLEKAINTKKNIASKQVAILPLEIHERESTKIFITNDDLVNLALNFIINNAHDGITVEDILQHVPASRRTLELRFKKATGRTLHEEIINAKIKRSKQLLYSSDIPMAVIGEQSGFASPQRFYEQFKKYENCTPTQYKNKLHNQ
ncbi:MAG: DNA-binding transcriptional regulator [Treponema sp.]|nr:DNA-binding transcriptional regulator [Treponema sp.]